MQKIKLLFVEDDPSFSYIVKESLELTNKYEICAVSNGKEGLDAYSSFSPDIIVADIEMPVMNGLQMVQIIRQKDSDIPILFATGRTKAQDVLDGYKLYVDNFIKKPYIPDEIDAHIQAIMKRAKERVIVINNERDVFLGEYIFNVDAHFLLRENKKQKLTPKEANILWMLYEKKGELVKRSDILKEFWGYSDYFPSRSLDVFISTLRKYLSLDPNIRIQTVPKEGFRLVVP
ncbi:DNA-binding response regulator [Bacteroidia bacterium]|nr:DNA-binding response regulator [Bacteroidia bacterium]